ncbi:hypothetical protein T459_09642 [Capsicum annuum]|uniref:Retrotransposon gag domain-containing protein n=1 Tax=Capsicum annuum TaxID=4072 RepID=A0A2G2ZZY1_CAPAN|nr:hypothetical protein T459_09642 [Capsicum annuum]
MRLFGEDESGFDGRQDAESEVLVRTCDEETFPGTMTITETRAKTTEENVNKLEVQLQNYMAETNKNLESSDSKMDDLNHKFDVMMERFFANREGILGSSPADVHHAENSGSRPRMVDPQDNCPGRLHNHYSGAKVECPYFEDGDPRSWLQKCERYFSYHHLIDAQN